MGRHSVLGWRAVSLGLLLCVLPGCFYCSTALWDDWPPRVPHTAILDVTREGETLRVLLARENADPVVAEVTLEPTSPGGPVRIEVVHESQWTEAVTAEVREPTVVVTLDGETLRVFDSRPPVRQRAVRLNDAPVPLGGAIVRVLATPPALAIDLTLSAVAIPAFVLILPLMMAGVLPAH